MSRPRVLLLPAVGQPASMYDALVEQVAPRADVVVFPYPSPRSFDYDGPALLERLVEACVHAVGSDGPFAVVGGTSLGGTLAFPLEARLAPEALLLIASSGLPVARARKDGIRAALAATTPARFGREHLEAVGDDAECAAAARLLEAALEVDYRALMERPRARAAVVSGARDRIFPPRHAARLAAAVRGATLHVLPDVGHFPSVDDPRSVARILEELLP